MPWRLALLGGEISKKNSFVYLQKPISHNSFPFSSFSYAIRNSGKNITNQSMLCVTAVVLSVEIEGIWKLNKKNQATEFQKDLKTATL